MAIKFRCPHCRQLLGISTSKAGTIVDCPACGRSVHVPNEGGVATKTEQTSRPSDHPGLLNALNALSALGSANENVNQPPAILVAVPRARKLSVALNPATRIESNATAARDAMRIVPLANGDLESRSKVTPEAVLSELAELQPVEDSAPLILPELLEPGIPDMAADFASREKSASSGGKSTTSTGAALKTRPLPNDLSSALQELAFTAPVVTEPPATISHPTVTKQSPIRRFLLFPMMLITPAFAMGFLVGMSWKPHIDRGITNADPDSAIAPVAVILAPAVGERQLNGVVRFIDDSGNSTADSGAVVLLLPTENATRLRLDARPLREAPNSTSRQAIEAALRTLGGFVHQADDSGHWSANVPSNAALNVVVVSRHRSRSDSQPVPDEIQSTLSNWFDSPLHITGRLSVQQFLVPLGSNNDDRPPVLQETEFSR